MTAAAAAKDHFDTLIVGGGVAGLTVAEALAKKGVNVAILDKWNNWGGRAYTFYGKGPLKGIQYEIGAGRIFAGHTRVNALVKRFGLHTYPITTASTWRSAAAPAAEHVNDFTELFEPLRRVLGRMAPDTLATHTLAELVPRSLHPLFARYPYWAEIALLRADMALAAFAPRAPHGASGDAAYYGVAEGLSALGHGLADAAAAAGATLLPEHTVTRTKRLGANLFEVQGTREGKDGKFTFTANRIVIATCRCSLSSFDVLKGAPLLKQLGTSPLTRIYAIYPPDKSGAVWFDKMPKIVTDSPLRFVIPINPKTGLIMISYTDGDDTHAWKGLDGARLTAAIQKEAQRLFPEKTIPEPTYLKKHEWSQGCTYWLPGAYDVAKASAAAHNPFPEVYVCGESVSMQQTWIEGALESAETLLKLL
jgi:glycine/D-amino acid oxidase-like deaminating enzyme